MAVMNTAESEWDRGSKLDSWNCSRTRACSAYLDRTKTVRYFTFVCPTTSTVPEIEQVILSKLRDDSDYNIRVFRKGSVRLVKLGGSDAFNVPLDTGKLIGKNVRILSDHNHVVLSTVTNNLFQVFLARTNCLVPVMVELWFK